MCFTNSLVKNEETGNEMIAKKQIWDVATTKELLYHDDFHNDNIPMMPGHTSSFIFRNNIIATLPHWFEVLAVADFPLFIILSKHGKAKFINEVTSVYRIHSKGISTYDFDYLKFYKHRIFIYKKLNDYLERRYYLQINTLISKHYINIFKYFKRKRQYLRSILPLIIALRYNTKEVLTYLSSY